MGMKKLALAMAAAAALMFTSPAVPGVSSDAQAQTVVKKKVVIKRSGGDVRRKVVINRSGGEVRRKVVIRTGDRGRHLGWRHNARKKVVIIKNRGGHHNRGATVIKRKTTVVR
jgi:2-methylaconitate cis-trans-isomerase PrpF